jgi:hypothetical protein
MEAAFAEAMAGPPERMMSAVADEADAEDRHGVVAGRATRADVIVTNNVRHLAADRMAESRLLVQTADESSSTGGGWSLTPSRRSLPWDFSHDPAAAHPGPGARHSRDAAVQRSE